VKVSSEFGTRKYAYSKRQVYPASSVNTLFVEANSFLTDNGTQK